MKLPRTLCLDGKRHGCKYLLEGRMKPEMLLQLRRIQWMIPGPHSLSWRDQYGKFRVMLS